MSKKNDFDLQIQEVCERVRANEVGASNELVRLLEPALMVRLRQKVPADRLADVYQETWERFFQGILDGKRPNSYCAWFLGISRFVNFEHGRKESKTMNLPETIEAILESRTPELEKAAHDHQRLRDVTRCLDKMPQRYRGFLLGHAQGLSKETLCEMWGVKPSNYSKFLHRTRCSLYKLLEWDHVSSDHQ